MTLDEAFEFFAKYGGVSTEVEKLKNTKPESKELIRASIEAARRSGDNTKTNEAFCLINEHFGLDAVNNL